MPGNRHATSTASTRPSFMSIQAGHHEFSPRSSMHSPTPMLSVFSQVSAQGAMNSMPTHHKTMTAASQFSQHAACSSVPTQPPPQPQTLSVTSPKTSRFSSATRLSTADTCGGHYTPAGDGLLRPTAPRHSTPSVSFCSAFEGESQSSGGNACGASRDSPGPNFV